MNHTLHQLDIILPCYNPDEGFVDILASTAAGLQRQYPGMEVHLIIVNDGSVHGFTDDVKSTLLKAIPGTDIVDLEQNRGKGKAVRAGIARSKAPYAIYTDIDMPYSMETMTRVIDKMHEGFDVTIAIRNKNYYSKLSRARLLMSHGSKFLNSLFLGIKHTDTQGGLKGLSLKAKKIMLQTRIDDFLFDTEFVVLASRDKSISITEVDSTLRKGVKFSHISSKIVFRELYNFFTILFHI